MGETDQIVPRGPFSLQAAAEFGFGRNEGVARGVAAAALAELAERRRAFRTWARVLMQVAGERGTRIQAGQLTAAPAAARASRTRR